VKKFQFIEYAGGCPGLDLRDDKINFRVGDKIEIKGTFTKINPKCGGVILNLDNWGWTQFQGWGYWSQGEFEQTFIVTQKDIDGGETKYNWEGTPYKTDIKGNHPAGIRLRSSGVDEPNSWENRYPGGIGKVTIEQIKISGYR